MPKDSVKKFLTRWTDLYNNNKLKQLPGGVL